MDCTLSLLMMSTNYEAPHCVIISIALSFCIYNIDGTLFVFVIVMCSQIDRWVMYRGVRIDCCVMYRGVRRTITDSPSGVTPDGVSITCW
jgi:hypothetical protein